MDNCFRCNYPNIFRIHVMGDGQFCPIHRVGLCFTCNLLFITNQIFYDCQSKVFRVFNLNLCPTCGEIPNDDVTSGCEDPLGCGKIKGEHCGQEDYSS